MGSRPHPSELKTGDVIAPPWGSPIRALKVTRVEETTLGEALGDKLNSDIDPSTPGWAVWGHRWYGNDMDACDEPEDRLVFGGVGNPMYQRPILVKGAEQDLGAEL
jgi:hypothetical protein